MGVYKSLWVNSDTTELNELLADNWRVTDMCAQQVSISVSSQGWSNQQANGPILIILNKELKL